MFIEIEVASGANCPLSMTRMFSAIDRPVPVSFVKTAGPSGDESSHEVTGWSSQGPCQAYAVLVEDSGEGIALLIYGGDEGVRLKPAGSTEPWNLASPNQWGEPCLLLDKEALKEIAEAD
jgi:hypothetical protein